MDILYDGWDMFIGFPPCTYTSFAGNRYFNIEKYGDLARERLQKRAAAEAFFLKLWKAPIKKKALENPMGSIIRLIKPSQIIQPWYFGDCQQKRTLLWLSGLPRLNGKIEIALNRNSFKPAPTYIDKRGKKRYFADSITGSRSTTQKERSKTFQGIADAMAAQWG